MYIYKKEYIYIYILLAEGSVVSGDRKLEVCGGQGHGFRAWSKSWLVGWSVGRLVGVGETVSDYSQAAHHHHSQRWLLSDWMDPKTSKKAAALPLLPKSKFNSGDNPILAATALIMATGVVFSVLGLWPQSRSSCTRTASANCFMNCFVATSVGRPGRSSGSILASCFTHAYTHVPGPYVNFHKTMDYDAAR